MRLIRAIDLSRTPEAATDDAEPKEHIWYWYAQPSSADDDGTRTARQSELLTDHLQKARDYAHRIASRLVAPREATAVAQAAHWHDLGKNRRVWQRSIGNVRPEVLAKSGPGMRAREITRFRHELGSILDLHDQDHFGELSIEERDLVAHLIAAHHGRARPHFPRAEAFDPERPEATVAAEVREVPLRFARLQRRYGRWGLAYLESLVRAADALASQDIGSGAKIPEAAE
jgi:CRISPR-associated endonuclease/helicase Cas3